MSEYKRQRLFLRDLTFIDRNTLPPVTPEDLVAAMRKQGYDVTLRDITTITQSYRKR